MTDEDHIDARTSWLHVQASGPLAIIIMFGMLTAGFLGYLIDRQTTALVKQTTAFDRMAFYQRKASCLLAIDQDKRHEAASIGQCSDYNLGGPP